MQCYFTRVAKRRVRQRLHEATVAVASSSEHAKRQSMLRRRLAGLQFARDYVDKLAAANASEIHTMHDEAQHELSMAEVICERLSPTLAAGAGAKHRLLRAQGVLQGAWSGDAGTGLEVPIVGLDFLLPGELGGRMSADARCSSGVQRPRGPPVTFCRVRPWKLTGWRCLLRGWRDWGEPEWSCIRMASQPLLLPNRPRRRFAGSELAWIPS